MPALIESKVVEPSARASFPGLGGGSLYQELPAFPWTRAALMAVQLAGLALATAGSLIGVGVLWTQLARALPIVGLLHHLRALRAVALVAAGVGLMALGRRR